MDKFDFWMSAFIFTLYLISLALIPLNIILLCNANTIETIIHTILCMFFGLIYHIFMIWVIVIVTE